MFAAVVLALFAYSVCKFEVQCSVIRRESHVSEAKDSMELMKNLTLLKKIENLAIQSRSATPSQVKNKKSNILTGKNKPQVDFNGTAVVSAALPIDEVENRVLTSSIKNLQPKSDVGKRQPKFFGSLGFLTGLGAASLATAASANANAFVKLLNAAVPVPIGHPGYITGFYEPQQYLPFSYPVLYPVPRLANQYQNFVSGIMGIPAPLPQQIPNITAGKSPPKTDTNSARNDEANKLPPIEKPQEGRDATVAVQADDHEEKIDSTPVVNEEAELRQVTNKPTTTSTTTERPMMNSTLVSNVTAEPAPSATNATISLPFYGYYGGSPHQDVGHLLLTTEDPHQRYLKDYTEEAFSPPYQRPAVFSPYQNVDSYSNPFVNSFSSSGQFPEFLNTIESDRYVYDSENRRNFNGFRPILK